MALRCRSRQHAYDREDKVDVSRVNAASPWQACTQQPCPHRTLNPFTGGTPSDRFLNPNNARPPSATNSPTLKGKDSNRRASLIVNHVNSSRQNSPSTANHGLNEFGVLENVQTPKAATTQRHSVRASPSVSTSTSRVPRQTAIASSSTANGVSARKNRESLSFSGLRKTSTGSVSSINASAAAQEDHPHAQNHRFSALSPSKLKLLSPKISLPSRGSSSSQSIAQTMASPSIHRQTTSTPSPVSSVVDDEELVGDEEMMQYIKRQQAKKLAAGATQAELDELLKFPEPIPPAAPASPACKSVLNFSKFVHSLLRSCSQKQPGQLSLGIRVQGDSRVSVRLLYRRQE